MKTQTSKEKVLRVRLSEHEQMKLEAYATKHDISMSHVIREYIRRLPNPEDLRVGKAKSTYSKASRNARRKQLDLFEDEAVYP